MAIFALDDRNSRYGPLKEHFMRIGDTQFFVPPTSISIHRQMKKENVSVMRAKNSLPKESGYFDRIITLTLFFPNRDSINHELRPILAQSKKSPFLPIENTYLNDIHQIEAITIQNITIQTTPGFPNTLQAIIQCYAFEPSTYIYDIYGRTFDEMFHWPMFRWYYERHLTNTEVVDPVVSALFDGEKVERKLTHFKALDDELTNEYLFEISSEEDLDAIKMWNKEKKELIRQWQNDKEESTFESWIKGKKGKKAMQDKFDEDFYDLYEKAAFEYDISYEAWDMPRLELTDFSISLENSIISQQLQMHQSPTHQYLGSQDTMMVMRFQTDDEEALASLENLMRRTSYLTREYHKEVANGFLRINHQLAELYGVKNVVIDDMTVDTVEGFPGVYNITLSLMAYNRAEKKMHETKAMTLDLNWDMNIVDRVPPFIKHMKKGMFSVYESEIIGDDAEQQAIYDAYVLETFKVAELYPDLELPTYTEVSEAGFTIENLNNGLFVDPDFFINYDNERDFSMILDRFVKQGSGEIDMMDAAGGKAILNENGVKPDEATDRKNREIEELSKIKTPKLKVKSDISKEKQDENLPKSETEILLRKSAFEYGLNEKYILAFVQSFDPEYRHFYNKGVNTGLGDKSVDEKGKVISYDKSLNLNDDGYYIGVMRVSKNFDKDNAVKNNVRYNIDIGMRYMSYYYHFIEYEIFNNNSMEYNLDHIFETFNYDYGSNEDQEKVKFICTMMLYLGFEKELSELLDKGKKPGQKILNQVKSVMSLIDKVDAWDYKDLNDKYDELKVKDYKGAIIEVDQNEQIEEIDKLSGEDMEEFEKSMFYDMLNHDRRGRLLRAFPTFFLTFIDEGQFVGSIKMSDQYFNYKAISDITYNNTRKMAASTLVCELANVFGSLDDADKSQDLTHTGLSDLILSATLPGLVAKNAEKSRHRNPDFYKSIYLRTGVRVHMRMGYGANAANLPTIMNGTITSLQNNGPTMTMIAQNDGIELTNKLNALLDIDPEDDTSGFISNRKDVTEIVDELLTDSDGFIANMSKLLSNKEYNYHSLGLMHFGETGPPQGIADIKRTLFYFGTIKDRKISEINMNVYQTTGLTNEHYDSWWNKFKASLNIGESAEDSININLFDKTVWDVLNIAASIGPDMITAVHPFGLRNTIFLGKPYFPLNYDYDVDLEKEEISNTKKKSFKQMHIYDSYTSIIHNEIEATEEDLFTVAVGTYMNEGKTETTSPVYVDTHIWPEKQKTVNIDTTLNATGVKLKGVGKIPFIGDMLNKPAKWYFDEGVALKITAAGLRDYVKDMYDGYLTVMGDPSVKPYDSFVLHDYYMSMNGPADVKEVVHIMNHDVGFITMIKPDVIAYNSDEALAATLIKNTSIATGASMALYLRSLLSSRGYGGASPIMNALWSYTKKRMNTLKGKFSGSKLIKGSKSYSDQLADKIKSTSKRYKDRGMIDQLAKDLKIDKKNMKNFFDGQSKRFYNSQITNKIDQKTLNKIKKSSSNGLKMGKKGFGKAVTGIKNIVRVAWKGKHVAGGPMGIITFAAETVIMSVLTATIGEFTGRFLMNRQAVVVIPLRKDNIEFTAGVNGHKGSVMTSAKEVVNNLSGLEKGILELLGKDFEEEVQNEEALYGPQTFATSTKSKGTVKQNSLLEKSFVLNPYHKDDGTIEKYYKEDVEAAKEEVSGRLALLESRMAINMRPDYSDLEEQELGFQGLLQKILGFFGKGDDGTGGDFNCGDDVSLNGKAINLSSGFSKIGPLIEKEAKKQEVGGYAEILKAQVMQESSGNWQKTPDVFQASESLGLSRNSIGLERSIEQGVKYFKQNLKKGKGDVRLALQGYNFGSGFIDYVSKRGGKWTQGLVNSYSNMQAKKMGWRRYGDKNYIKNILRYYKGSIDETCMSGTDDAPDVTGASGKAKYRLTASQAKSQLINPRNQKGRVFGITLVGSSNGYMRKGSYELFNQVAKQYKSDVGQTINITSTYRPGDSNWHGTGYAVDADTPNTMRRLGHGKLGFPNGKDKNNARKLVEIAIKSGFDAIYFGDWDIVQEMKKKYKGISITYEPNQHHNHLHLSYPKKKK